MLSAWRFLMLQPQIPSLPPSFVLGHSALERNGNLFPLFGVKSSGGLGRGGTYSDRPSRWSFPHSSVIGRGRRARRKLRCSSQTGSTVDGQCSSRFNVLSVPRLESSPV